MTAPTALDAFVAKAMELADRYATAAIEFNLCIMPEQRAEPSALLESARAALEAHLREVPMGEPVAFEVPHNNFYSGKMERYADVTSFGGSPDWRQYALEAGFCPLYRHPKELT